MTHKATPVTGGCLCGLVRYEADVFLHNGYICHCTICQRSTGQPAEITVLIRAGTLRYLHGEPHYFVSSDTGKRGFCGTCGSRIVWQALRPEDDWMTNVTVGTLDNPSAAVMTRHIFADTALPWYRPCDDLPRFAEADTDALMRQLAEEVAPADGPFR